MNTSFLELLLFKLYALFRVFDVSIRKITSKNCYGNLNATIFRLNVLNSFIFLFFLFLSYSSHQIRSRIEKEEESVAL